MERGDDELRSDMIAIVGMYGSPVHGCNDADELGELVHAIESAPRRIHVLGQVIHIDPHAVVWIEECRDIPLRVLDRYLNI